MAQSADAAYTDKSHEKTSFFKKAGSEIADFGEGLFHGAIENPVNGVVQIANHTDLVHLPEMHLVDEERLSRSAGGVIGTVAGTAIDIYAASVATGGIAGALGGSGMMGAALRFGAVGAAYSTVFQPTDANSKHFLADRLTNGGIALGTFAAMGGAAAALDGTGVFAVPAARSLVGTLTYGAIAGAAGGVAHAETSAVLKDGRAIPTLGGLATDIGTYGAFGMAYAGAGYGFNQLTAQPPKTFTSDNTSAKVFSDPQGHPVKVEASVPGLHDPDVTVNIKSTLMTNGQWSSSADNNAGYDTVQPQINNVTVNGDKLTMSGADGIKREFIANGPYKRTNMPEEARKAADAEEYAKYHKTEDINGVTTGRVYDEQMRLKSLRAGSADSWSSDGANIYYDQSNNVTSFSARQGDQNISLSRQENGSWRVSANNQVYTWNGDVHVAPPAAPGGAEQIQLVASGGTGQANYDLKTGFQQVSDLMKATSQYVPGGTGRPVLTVDNSGHATLTGSTGSGQQFVNGEQVPAGKTVAIKPGDDVQMKVDVGDRYTIYEDRAVKWGVAADGTATFGTTPLKPGTQSDFVPNDASTVLKDPDRF